MMEGIIAAFLNWRICEQTNHDSLKYPAGMMAGPALPGLLSRVFSAAPC